MVKKAVLCQLSENNISFSHKKERPNDELDSDNINIETLSPKEKQMAKDFKDWYFSKTGKEKDQMELEITKDPLHGLVNFALTDKDFIVGWDLNPNDIVKNRNLIRHAWNTADALNLLENKDYNNLKKIISSIVKESINTKK